MMDSLSQTVVKFVPRCPIDNKSTLIQVMAWRQTGYKPLPEPMLTHFTDKYMLHWGRWVKNLKLVDIFLWCIYLLPALLRKILVENPSKRATISVISKHQWFNKSFANKSKFVEAMASIFNMSFGLKCNLANLLVLWKRMDYYLPRADSRFAPSQWETALLCNDVSHWLGANLESALPIFIDC